ncbi:hypothetical protein BU15DRAFT_67800 [Melanogaster broomeanus]|nr:hypothetical protein BU15DRAFT_67800 [Melanogaster broomeanus]
MDETLQTLVIRNSAMTSAQSRGWRATSFIAQPARAEQGNAHASRVVNVAHCKADGASTIDILNHMGIPNSQWAFPNSIEGILRHAVDVPRPPCGHPNLLPWISQDLPWVSQSYYMGIPNSTGVSQIPTLGIPIAPVGIPHLPCGHPKLLLGYPKTCHGSPKAYYMGIPNLHWGIPNSTLGIPIATVGIPNFSWISQSY